MRSLHPRQHLRGAPRKRNATATAPPPKGRKGLLFRADAAVVEIVRVVVAAEPDVTSAWVGFRLHVGASVLVPAPVYVTEQARFTVPVKPPAGDSWMESVTDPPAELMVRELDAGISATVAPVPTSDTVCGDVLELSVTVSVPVREPPAVGVNVTEIAQFAPVATLDPQVFVSAKSPDAAMDVMLKAADPLFVSVTV